MLTRFIYFILLFFLSCDNNDIGLIPYKENYHRIEFDITKNNNIISKRVGVSNVLIFNEKDYENTEFIFYGIYKGILFISSNECSINKSFKYSGKFKINLSDLVDYSTHAKCNLKLTLETDRIQDKYLIETGEINIIFIKEINDNFKTTFIDPETSKIYSFFKDYSFQIRAGDLKRYSFLIDSPVSKGILKIKGCKVEDEREIFTPKITLNFDYLFGKKTVDRLDSCLLNIKIKYKNKTFEQYIYLSIFDSNVKRLPKSSFLIKDDILEISSPSFVNICSINSSYILNPCAETYVTCSGDYSSDEVYWIRGITSKGRKSIYAIKNGNVIWEE